MPSAPVFAAPRFPQERIDDVLLMGTNDRQGRLHIISAFQKGKTMEEIAAFLQTEYKGGMGLETPNGKLSAWFAEDGIQLSWGSSARHASAYTLPWLDVVKRIRELLEQGNYATTDELALASINERQEAAQELWYLRQDLSDAAIDQGILSTVSEHYRGFFDSVAELTEMLNDPDQLRALTEEVGAFAEAYARDHELLRFHFHRPAAVVQRLEELALPRRAYESILPKAPAIKGFITQDEIDDALSHGSNGSGGKHRIYAYFRERHTPEEKAAFLKKEYGIGGHNDALAGAFNSDEMHDSKGIRYKKDNAPDVLLSWRQVSKRIDLLLARDRYLTQEEQESLRQRQAEADLALAQPADAPSRDFTSDYQLLDRLRSDCEYFLGAGQRNEKDLWTGNVRAQIAKMRELYDALPEKPEWLTAEAIDRYAERMSPKYQVVVYHHFENGFDEKLEYQTRQEAEDAAQGYVDGTMEADGFAYDGAAVYDLQEQRYLRVLGDYPDETAQAQMKAATEQVPAEIQPEPDNFRITDDNLGAGGAKAKYAMNAAAIRTLKAIEAAGRPATREEQETLSRYVGWGGIPQAFEPENAAWAKEYTELKELLTDEEYNMARASTLNAHYTSPTVIREIYKAVERMGFSTGNILEPACGVGNFFGLLPESMAASNLYGVELDNITGRIARQLYPKADITVSGFEETDRRDFYDLAVGNVPFGRYKVADRAFDKYNFLIHDYFFAKSIDQVRPGGVIAFITSKGTMDKQSPEVRKYIAQRAELLGAVRLPNNAFKANAGTEVTSDILFLQKRDRPIVTEPDWVHLGQTDEGIPINHYFAEHPEMVLGTMAWDDSMYGNQQETACLPIEGANLSDQLSDALHHITGRITEVELPDLGDGDAVDASIPADPDVKNFSYTIVDGEVYYRENSRMVKPELKATVKERVKGLVELRDCVRDLIDQQMDNAPDVIIRRTQERLNARYDAFTSQYDLINSRGNANAFSDDSSYYLLCSLEVLDENRSLARKADMFTKRTIRPARAVEHVSTASEALAVTIAEHARVDMPYMSALTGRTEAELAAELQGVIFRLPDLANKENTQYVAADEYLSGNIRQKLAVARLAAEADPAFQGNVSALEQAMPHPLDASEIDARLGATWINKTHIQSFMEELLKPASYVRKIVKVNFSSVTAEWNISNKSAIPYNDVAAYATYGTQRASAYRILEDTLNLRDVRIYDTVQDANGSEKRVLNKNETTLAQQKQQVLKDAFRDWIWQDADRRQELIQTYNELFNSTRPREYDGQHLSLAGMNPEIILRPHQRDAIARILYGGNTLLAHEVGAGKTYEMVAACMELRRLGLCSKAVFVVPNHLTEQWASEFLRLYPSANILVAAKRDFSSKNRKKFCSRIATGDYDAVIIGQTQFEKIPLSRERQERLLRDQIDEIEDGIAELKRAKAERFTIKQMERSKKQLLLKLEKLTSTERKDDVVIFEELGIDRLFVDESHYYKNRAIRCA